MHIPIFWGHRKFLRFCIAGQCYQWKCLFWSHNGSESVYKNNVSRDSTFKDSEHLTGILSGRLVSRQSDEKSSFSRSREMPQSSDFTRFPSKQRDIRISSQTGYSIHRGHFSFQVENSDTNSRE